MFTLRHILLNHRADLSELHFYSLGDFVSMLDFMSWTDATLGVTRVCGYLETGGEGKAPEHQTSHIFLCGGLQD